MPHSPRETRINQFCPHLMKDPTIYLRDREIYKHLYLLNVTKDMREISAYTRTITILNNYCFFQLALKVVTRLNIIILIKNYNSSRKSIVSS